MRYSGIIEVARSADAAQAEECRAHRPGRSVRDADRPTRTIVSDHIGARFKEDRKFALASASLRQALQDMPEITEVSKHIMIEETEAGPQHRDRRPGRPLDVSRRLEGAL